jgi:hypothetical protein
MIFLVANQIHWLANGLHLFDAILIIPVFQGCFILFGVIGGGVFFDEFAQFEIWEAIVFSLGIASTLIGVCLLALREKFEPPTVIPETMEAVEAAPSKTADGLEDPLPLSFRHGSLVVSDLYTAFLDSVSTPERSAQRRASFSAPTMQNAVNRQRRLSVVSPQSLPLAS